MSIGTCLLFVVVGVVGKICPSLVDAALNIYRKGEKRTVADGDLRNSVLNWKSFKDMIDMTHCAIVQLRVWEGGPAPNPSLVDLNGITQYHLLEFAKKGRPLVVNFGSCT